MRKAVVTAADERHGSSIRQCSVYKLAVEGFINGCVRPASPGATFTLTSSRRGAQKKKDEKEEEGDFRARKEKAELAEEENPIELSRFG